MADVNMMAKNPQFTALAGVLCLVLLFGSATETAARAKGYLAVLGPAPLRFQAPRPAFSLSLLPPLVPRDTNNATAGNQATNPPVFTESTAITNQAVTEVATPAAGASEPDAAAPAPIVTEVSSSPVPQFIPELETPAPPEEVFINPQSVIGYLAPAGTNSIPINMVLPPFVPPIPPRPSKATYESR